MHDLELSSPRCAGKQPYAIMFRGKGGIQGRTPALGSTDGVTSSLTVEPTSQQFLSSQ